jgi:hypothetical protein
MTCEEKVSDAAAGSNEAGSPPSPRLNVVVDPTVDCSED